MPVCRNIRSLCPQDIVALREDIEERRDDTSARGGGPLRTPRRPARRGGGTLGRRSGPVGGGRRSLSRATGPIHVPRGSLARPLSRQTEPSAAHAEPSSSLSEPSSRCSQRARRRSERHGWKSDTSRCDRGPRLPSSPGHAQLHAFGSAGERAIGVVVTAAVLSGVVERARAAVRRRRCCRRAREASRRSRNARSRPCPGGSTVPW